MLIVSDLKAHTKQINQRRKLKIFCLENIDTKKGCLFFFPFSRNCSKEANCVDVNLNEVM